MFSKVIFYRSSHSDLAYMNVLVVDSCKNGQLQCRIMDLSIGLIVGFKGGPVVTHVGRVALDFLASDTYRLKSPL